MAGSHRASSPATSAAAQRVPLVLFGAIGVAELVLRAGGDLPGLALYGIVLVLGLNYGSTRWDPDGALAVALAPVAVARIVGVAGVLVLAPAWAGLVTTVSIVLATVLAARVLRFGRHELGLVLQAPVGRFALGTLALGLGAGLVAGVLEATSPVLRLGTDPGAGIAAWSFAAVVIEEVAFRGLLQHAASDRLGTPAGIVYVAALFALLAVSPWSVALAVVFPFAVLLSLATALAGSVFPSIAARIGLLAGLAAASLLVTGRIIG